MNNNNERAESFGVEETLDASDIRDATNSRVSRLLGWGAMGIAAITATAVLSACAVDTNRATDRTDNMGDVRDMEISLHDGVDENVTAPTEGDGDPEFIPGIKYLHVATLALRAVAIWGTTSEDRAIEVFVHIIGKGEPIPVMVGPGEFNMEIPFPDGVEYGDKVFIVEDEAIDDDSKGISFTL